MTERYTTAVDRRFLARGLALHESLRRHRPDTVLWMLALDDGTRDLLRGLDVDGIRVVTEEAILDDDLLRARADRSQREYYFAVKPWLVGHVLDADRSATRITFLDGDQYCFADPSTVTAREPVASSAVALSPHRWTSTTPAARFGMYNAGWISFHAGADADAGDALRWWRERCREGTPDYPVGGRFSEQKYLDELPARFPRVVEVADATVNLGAWNVGAHSLTLGEDGRVCVDGDPLVLFHFHGIDRWTSTVFGFRGTARDRTSATVLRDAVVRPYLEAWMRWERRLPPAPPPFERPLPWGSTRPRPWWWRAARIAARRAGAVARRRVVRVPGSGEQVGDRRRERSGGHGIGDPFGDGAGGDGERRRTVVPRATGRHGRIDATAVDDW